MSVDDQQVLLDIKFLLGFAPAERPEQVSPGLNPMFYLTGNYEGDVVIATRIQEMRDRYGIAVGEVEDDNDYHDGDDG